MRLAQRGPAAAPETAPGAPQRVQSPETLHTLGRLACTGHPEGIDAEIWTMGAPGKPGWDFCRLPLAF